MLQPNVESKVMELEMDLVEIRNRVTGRAEEREQELAEGGFVKAGFLETGDLVERRRSFDRLIHALGPRAALKRILDSDIWKFETLLRRKPYGPNAQAQRSILSEAAGKYVQSYRDGTSIFEITRELYEKEGLGNI